MQTVKKAVFPVAGLGSRFLPATKASPKEMLAIVDKPLIQYAVEEAIEAGATELIFVTSSSKRAIEDHFDANPELEANLREKNKLELLESISGIIPSNVTCIYIRQHEPKGLGHAILCAKPVIGNEPFMVSLADDLIYSDTAGCLSQMIEVFHNNYASVLASQSVPIEDSNKYGMIAAESNDESISAIKTIVEKPSPNESPSTTACVGRYIFTPEIFNFLDKIQSDNTGEIQLTPAIQMLIDIQPIFSYKFSGKRFDCGDKLGYLKATIEYGLNHKKLSSELKKHIKEVAQNI